MYSIYILYFLVIVILFLLLINKLNLINKENFNSNNINGSIVILNRLIKKINTTTDFSDKDKRLVKLISLDTIDI